MQRITFGRVMLVLALTGVLCLVLAIMTGHLFTHNGSDDTKTHSAQLGCTSLATAIDAYTQHKDNKQHELPMVLRDLVEPPFGGPSFLRNGETDLLDPWGKPCEMERRQFQDGREYILVKTTAPDGTPISQFGIGEKNSRPRE